MATMSQLESTFLEKADVKASDQAHKSKLLFNISKYDETVVKGKTQYKDLELARKKAKNIKWRAISELDKNLVLFEKNFTANGGKVIWAENTEEAQNAILEIFKKNNSYSNMGKIISAPPSNF